MGWQDAPLASMDLVVSPEVQQQRDQQRLSLLESERATETDSVAKQALDTEIEQTKKKVGPLPKWQSAPLAEEAAVPKKRSMLDVVNGPTVKASDDPKGGTAGVMDTVVNEAKSGLMALPGMLGNLEQLRDVVRAKIVPEDAGQASRFSSLLNPFQAIESSIIAARKVVGQEAKTAFPTSEELATKILGYDAAQKPATTQAKLAGEVANFFASGTGGLASTLVRKGVGAASKSAAELGALSGAAAGGGQLAEESFGEGEGAKAGGQLAAVIPYAWLRARAGGLASLATSSGRAELKEAATEKLGPVSQGMEDLFRKQAEEQLRSGIKEYPPSIANIKEATDLQGRINATLANTDQQVSLSAGRASAAPKIIADEMVARRSSSANVAAALADEQRNAAAILSYMTTAPEAKVSRKAAIDAATAEYNSRLQGLKDAETQVQDRARRLTGAVAPEMTAEERGAKLVDLRASEQQTENATRDRLYGLARDEAARTNATFDRSAIDLVADRITKNPILQYDAANMPAVIRNIKGPADTLESDAIKAMSVVNPDKAQQLQMRLRAGADAARAAEPKPPLTFDDISAMKKAVGQDIAVELRSTNPNKRQRLRALTEMANTVDGAIAESKFPEVASLYGAANDYYRTTYAPKFNKGVNAKLAMTDSFGQQKVIDEKVLNQYSSTVNGANQFIKLFGKNAEAAAVMEDHLMDGFSKAVIKDGVLDNQAYFRWLSKNNDVLRTLESGGVTALGKFREVRSAMQTLADRQAYITANQERLAKDQMTKVLGTTEHGIIVEKALQSPEAMGRLTNAMGQEGSKALAASVLRDVERQFTYPIDSGMIGIDSGKFSKWLTENQTSLKVMFRAAYGPQEGSEHMQRLLDANRMLAIQQRVPTIRSAEQASSIGKDPLAQRLGFSFRTLFNMVRAITGGRTSTPDATVALGGQSASFLATKTYNNLMARIATDPQSSKYLLDLAKGDGKKVLTADEVKRQARAIAGLAGTVGHLYAGAAHYGPSIGAIAPAVVEGVAQDAH